MDIEYSRPNEGRFKIDELIEIFGYDTCLEQTLQVIEQHEYFIELVNKFEIQPLREIVALAEKVGNQDAVFFWSEVIRVIYEESTEPPYRLATRRRWLERSKRDLDYLLGKNDASEGRVDAQKIKDSVDLVQYVASYGLKLKKTGPGKWRCECPFHSGDRDPSMFVYEDRKGWYCYACGKGGSVIDFVIEADGVDFKQACQMLART